MFLTLTRYLNVLNLHGSHTLLTWIDIVVASIVSTSAVSASLRGFAKESPAMFALGLAIVLTTYESPITRFMARSMISSSTLADTVNVTALFFFSLSLLLLVINFSLGTNLVTILNCFLGRLDRVFGFFLGILRGAVVGVIFFVFLFLVWGVETRPVEIRSSRSYQFLAQLTIYLAQYLPSSFQFGDFLREIS